VAAPLPEDIQEILRALDDNDRRVEALVRDLDPEQFNWRPDERSWSIAQCLDHLNATNRTYIDPMRSALERARPAGKARRGAIRPSYLGRWFVTNLEPPPRLRVIAPRKVVPAARKDRDEVMRERQRIQSEVKDVLREASGQDLNGIRFVNPFFSLLYFGVGTGFQVIGAHERRHLWQAERVKANPRFPQVSRNS
jgi:hypothetical protein